MYHSAFYAVDAAILCLILFAACVVMVVIGKKIRDRFLSHDEHDPRGGVSALLGALFGLWGFLLAFTFGNVSTRYESVRASMIEEANTIRTVILRVETFPDSMHSGFRADIKKYLQSRIDYYDYAGDRQKFNKSKKDAKDIGRRLWTRTIQASHSPPINLAASTMLSTLSTMFDVGSRRDALLMSGLPESISSMLFFIAMVISFVGGFTSPVLRTKEWVVITSFIFLACLTIYITFDLARPMSGFIRPDVEQEKVVQLQDLL